MLQKLYQQGARALWIHNTGPIGCLPYSLFFNPPKANDIDPHGCVASHNRIAQEFNRQLKEWVSKLRLQLHDAKLNYIDVYSAKYSMISEAEKHGFFSPLTYCCGQLGGNSLECWNKATVNGTEVFGTICEDPLKVISWDSVHYTHAANEWVANRIVDGSLSDIHVPIGESCPESSAY
ncbi:hypothetical protein SAY86_002424 [Trapa natans]|uniref:Uncharacterized protein n=1 Tax=Trapa natans TaxID=22666 RepID=A0AAN7R2F7_TRANT|nr:hypothetical protein SAY86_002424 [Trapa natans]